MEPDHTGPSASIRLSRGRDGISGECLPDWSTGPAGGLTRDYEVTASSGFSNPYAALAAFPQITASLTEARR